MNTNPLISVIITTYNRPNLIKRSIDSVLKQTYKNIELVIIDDSSKNILELPDDNRIIYFRNKKNKGVQYSRNKGLSMVSGTYVLNLDDDDYFHKKRIEILYQAFKKGKYSFICSNYQYIIGDQISRKINKVNIKEIKLNDILFSSVVGPSIFTKTQYIKEVGGWDLKLNSAQDLDLWIRLIYYKGKALRVDNNLLTVDQSPERSRISNNKKVLKGYYIVYLKHKNLMNKEQIKYNMIKFRRQKGLKNSFAKILKYTPSYLLNNELKIFVNKIISRKLFLRI